MTQKDLASMTDCTEAAISHYIKGDRVPRSKVMAKIAQSLDTTTDYLMDGIPQDAKSEISYATKLIARNSTNMTKEEKREILELLMRNTND